MKLDSIEARFASMGARFRALFLPDRPHGPTQYALDVRPDRLGQCFELRVPTPLRDRLEVGILQARPRERHLLLMIRREEPDASLDRFLCGHDEREWFAAAVPGAVSSVAAAMESLKPIAVRNAQAAVRLPSRQWYTRHNRAFHRQGEWFFVPVDSLAPDPRLILRDEPIRRGRGKPHFVEELYRLGGAEVYVCRQYPNGIPEKQYRRLIEKDPKRISWGWRVMRRNPQVYARGDIRHPDHRTLRLHGWHQVFMNTETAAGAMQQLAFLD